MIKPRYHASVRTPHRRTSSPSVSTGPAIALVDERYLIWLASQTVSAPVRTLQRGALHGVMAQLARAGGAEGGLLRTVLFTDQACTELHDDVVIRTVPAHASDGGLSLVRALGGELAQLARHQPGVTLIVASDDERLIPYIDEAKWRGARVVLVADDSVHDFARLSADDPSWARLLLQADRRVALSPAAWDALTQPAGAESTDAGREADQPDEHWRAEVARIIDQWWSAQTDDERIDLTAAMRVQQGVPAEADRSILMQVRRELGRNLSFAEKRLMREMVRHIVLGEDAASAEAPAPEALPVAQD